jgi:hypothetical protein
VAVGGPGAKPPPALLGDASWLVAALAHPAVARTVTAARTADPR